MKARKEDDGQIKFYGELPSKWLGVTGNYVGGFNLMDNETLEREGFYEVEEPVHNKTLETLSPMYLDEERKVWTYNVEPKPDLPTLEQAKINRIEELKRVARDKFSETDWYYVRETRMKSLGIDKEIPSYVIEQNQELYNLIDQKENEINSLDDLELVLNFNVSLDNSKDIKEEQKPKEDIVEPVAEEGVVDPVVEENNPEVTIGAEGSNPIVSDANTTVTDNANTEANTPPVDVSATEEIPSNTEPKIEPESTPQV